MITTFFGLPRSGKTTTLASIALKYSRPFKGNPYSCVYSNVHLSIPGVVYIDNDCIGRYDLSNGLLLIDEAALFANCRDYRSFDRFKLEFFNLHGHYKTDIIFFTQYWDSIDKNIRVLTERVFYVYKPKIFGRWITRYCPIPYDIIIPKRGDGGDKVGDIIQGYCQANLFVRLFAPIVFRSHFYKYFDSWEAPTLPKLPEQYKPYLAPPEPSFKYSIVINKNKRFPVTLEKTEVV